ncbi:S49 family peptidase [Bauldia litoralis]|uniref:Signal peptide peptidase SppA n=1 Tax=Bauldia litoralis TaxID=665467 RepID=A0A1G6C8A3_9HYPH|nr:S49 family peptidase [Bauldia litoralis]SDB29024.1 signal peptide peptidase SppA [Bauldia litoralis]
MAFSVKGLFSRGGPVIPVVRLSGSIGTGPGLRPSLSLAGVEPLLARAFGIKAAPAVAIVVNSPGGAAVQSHLIHKRIRQLADEKDKHVIVAVEDVAASGGYMIAAAGDEILVDASSIVGSIGVIFAGFGFEKLIDKIGVERRIHTAGSNKAVLDPFSPEKADDVNRLKAMQQDVHAAFIALVRDRRKRLADDPDLFTGAFWSGGRAVDLGLADRIADLPTALKEKYGDKVEMKPIAASQGFLRRRLGMAAPGMAVAAQVEGVVGALEERLLWERYGL